MSLAGLNGKMTLILASSIIAFSAFISTNYLDSVFAESFEEDMSEDGKYLTMSSSVPENIEELTISSWVTPDYSEGSSQMTIVSRENAYALGLEKSDRETKIIFTIFDGIKWQRVESSAEVNEVLMHIAATFGDSSIDVFFNGDHKATLSGLESMTLNDRGILKESPLQLLSSDSEDVVGAFVTEKRGRENVAGEFGGTIHVVELFNKKYDEQGIEDLFNASFEVQNFSEAEDLAPDVQEFNNGVVIDSSETTKLFFSSGTTELLLSSDTISNNENSEDTNSILDSILENFKRIAEKFTTLYGN